MQGMTGLAQITKIADSIASQDFDDGGRRVECLEVQVHSAKQLAELLKTASRENIFVFRGSPGRRPQKLRNRCIPGKQEKPVQAVFLNLSRMNKIVEHVKGDQVISIQTGMNVMELNTYLSNHGQWLPVEFLNDKTTIADVLDTADGGFLEPFSSGVKNLVLGMELAGTNGELIKTGGKIVKNVTGYDLSKLFTGSHSWLAVPHLVHLRLYSKPEKEAAFIVSGKRPQDLVALATNLKATGLPAYSLETVDARLLMLLARTTRDTVLSNDIKSVMHAVNSDESLLLVSTRGHKQVAEEVSKALRDIAARTKLQIASVPVILTNRIQRLSSEIFSAAKIDCIELSISGSAIRYFFETFWTQAHKPLWSCRPASGRLRVGFANDPDSIRVKERIEALKDFATLVNEDGWQPVTVAYPSADCELTVEQLTGDVDSIGASSAVIRRLKSKYDPNSILNPLVNY